MVTKQPLILKGTRREKKEQLWLYVRLLIFTLSGDNLSETRGSRESEPVNSRTFSDRRFQNPVRSDQKEIANNSSDCKMKFWYSSSRWDLGGWQLTNRLAATGLGRMQLRSSLRAPLDVVLKLSWTESFKMPKKLKLSRQHLKRIWRSRVDKQLFPVGNSRNFSFVQNIHPVVLDY